MRTVASRLGNYSAACASIFPCFCAPTFFSCIGHEGDKIVRTQPENIAFHQTTPHSGGWPCPYCDGGREPSSSCTHARLRLAAAIPITCPGRKDRLFDIACRFDCRDAEKGRQGATRRGRSGGNELYRSMTGGGNDSHITSLLYGGGPALINSAGAPWTAAYIATIGEPTADLRSNIAAEARARSKREATAPRATRDKGRRASMPIATRRHER